MPNMNFARPGMRELLSFFFVTIGENVYHSNGHRNGVINK